MTEDIKLKEVKTYLGTLRVGDEVMINWVPGGGTLNKSTQKVYAIWKREEDTIFLAFDKKGINDSDKCYDYGGEILKPISLKKILSNRIEYWREELQ